MLKAPADTVELVYESAKRVEMQEGIFSTTTAKEDTCFNDIDAVVLPDNLCPFGCKKKECPYDWDAKKCPHNLSEKTTDELSEYIIKSFYYGDEGVKLDHKKQVDPKLIEALMNYKTPGNYGRTNR